MGNLDYIKDFLTSYSFDESCIKQVTLTYQNIINSNNEDFDSPTISLSMKKVSIAKGDSFQLVATTSETSMIVYWFTRDPLIASVDMNGVVTGLSTGTTVCYAQVGKNTAMCSVTITPYQPDDTLYVTSDNTEIVLAVNDEYKIPLDVKLGSTVITNYELVGDVLNPNVCSFNNGNVKGLSIGETNLLLSVIYGDSYDQILFNITVYK